MTRIREEEEEEEELHSRVDWRHICLNCRPARSDDSSDIVRHSRHVTAPYKLTFYYYYYYYWNKWNSEYSWPRYN